MPEPLLPLPRLVIFDLDGTLVDTVPDIAVALNSALADLDLPSVSEAQVRLWVGNGARTLCGRAIARQREDTANPALAERLLERFLSRYAERTCKDSRIYPGVLECLDWLGARRVRLACVTNKPLAHTEKLLAALRLDEHFDLVLGGDSLARRKPDPLPMRWCLRHFGVSSVEALVVGDSANDVDAARAAGIDSVAVTYGYNQGRDVFGLGANLVLESLAELPGHLETSR